MTLHPDKAKSAIVDETRRSLRELRDILNREHIALTVLVFPILKRYEDWTIEEKASRFNSIQILEDFHIRYFDLLEALNKAIEDHVTLQESPHDKWHPSAEVARYFATYLFEKGLLAENHHRT